MRSILAGRSRVELSPREAAEAIAWASGVEGWDYGLAPVYIYPASGRGRECVRMSAD